MNKLQIIRNALETNSGVSIVGKGERVGRFTYYHDRPEEEQDPFIYSIKFTVAPKTPIAYDGWSIGNMAWNMQQFMLGLIPELKPDFKGDFKGFENSMQMLDGHYYDTGSAYYRHVDLSRLLNGALSYNDEIPRDELEELIKEHNFKERRDLQGVNSNGRYKRTIEIRPYPSISIAGIILDEERRGVISGQNLKYEIPAKELPRA